MPCRRDLSSSAHPCAHYCIHTYDRAGRDNVTAKPLSKFAETLSRLCCTFTAGSVECAARDRRGSEVQHLWEHGDNRIATSTMLCNLLKNYRCRVCMGKSAWRWDLIVSNKAVVKTYRGSRSHLWRDSLTLPVDHGSDRPFHKNCCSSRYRTSAPPLIASLLHQDDPVHRHLYHKVWRALA